MARKLWYLEEWRRASGLSQEALADRVNDLTESWGERAMKLSKSDVSKLERGKRRFNSDQLEAFSQALRCDPEDLIAYTPEEAYEVKRLVGVIIQRGRASDLRLLRAMAEEESTTPKAG